MSSKKRKIVVLFPGLGYTTDKPLFHYGKQLLKKHGYEIYELKYEAFEEKFTPANTKESELDPVKLAESRQRMLQFISKMVALCKRQFGHLPYTEASQVVFMSKSIGTSIAAVYEKHIGCKVVHVLFTPLEQTFQLLEKHTEGIAFYGTNDPWSDWTVLTSACHAHNIPLFITNPKVVY